MKKILISTLLLAVISLSGCLSITDEIFLEKDGSGRYSTTIDMTKLKEMLDMFKTMMPDTTQGKADDQLKGLDSLQNMWPALDSLPGITDVKRTVTNKYVVQVSFRFANTRTLDIAMARRSVKENEPPSFNTDYYSFEPGQFTCNDTSLSALGGAMKGMGNSSDPTDSLGMAMNMMKGMMGEMTYSTIYHLPGKVNSVSNKQSKISEDGKTVTLKVDLTASDIPQTLKNVIRYQK